MAINNKFYIHEKRHVFRFVFLYTFLAITIYLSMKNIIHFSSNSTTILFCSVIWLTSLIYLIITSILDLGLRFFLLSELAKLCSQHELRILKKEVVFGFYFARYYFDILHIEISKIESIAICQPTCRIF